MVEEQEEKEVPMELNPFANKKQNFFYDQQARHPTFQRQERELFEMAIILEGFVQKKTKGFINRY